MILIVDVFDQNFLPFYCIYNTLCIIDTSESLQVSLNSVVDKVQFCAELIIIIYLKSISNVHKHTSSVDYTQNGLYTLKQYDHYKN